MALEEDIGSSSQNALGRDRQNSRQKGGNSSFLLHPSTLPHEVTVRTPFAVMVVLFDPTKRRPRMASAVVVDECLLCVRKI